MAAKKLRTEFGGTILSSKLDGTNFGGIRFDGTSVGGTKYEYQNLSKKLGARHLRAKKEQRPPGRLFPSSLNFVYEEKTSPISYNSS